MNRSKKCGRSGSAERGGDIVSLLAISVRNLLDIAGIGKVHHKELYREENIAKERSFVFMEKK